MTTEFAAQRLGSAIVHAAAMQHLMYGVTKEYGPDAQNGKRQKLTLVRELGQTSTGRTVFYANVFVRPGVSTAAMEKGQVAASDVTEVEWGTDRTTQLPNGVQTGTETYTDVSEVAGSWHTTHQIGGVDAKPASVAELGELLNAISKPINDLEQALK
jgi:hypothetical protein